jgi:hypothetical protein
LIQNRSFLKCISIKQDYEETQAYFLSYSATDNNGEGKKTIVNLRITVADANDNPPVFEKKNYSANIDEGRDSFEPGKNAKCNVGLGKLDPINHMIIFTVIILSGIHFLEFGNHR